MPSSIHPAKRIFDLLLLTLISPFVAAFALLTLGALFMERLILGGVGDSYFYTETRMSEGVPFHFYKFNIFKVEVLRSMRKNATFVHTKDLERNGGITKVGWCLKQIYMDELPQLWCVLLGNMSIVGPRPVNIEVYERFMREGYTDKARVRAGLTGPYQSLKDDSTASAHNLDRWYADFVLSNPWHAIILNDMRIILRTMRVVLKARGL
ncbi:MAG: hypothetical protein RLZZ234_859 [Candidatus Parcubacteria bacterium]|jgi:lipopolysaccharide/colanic/teichoic acid biosynthesis glycosyltransferase